PGLSFRGERGIEFGLRARCGVAFLADFGARGCQFAFELGEPVALGEAPRGRRLGIRGGRKPVPAPQIALPRHEALSRLELAGEAPPVGAIDDTDPRKPAGKL